MEYRAQPLGHPSVARGAATDLGRPTSSREVRGWVRKAFASTSPTRRRSDDSELRTIELEVNARIGENSAAIVEQMPYAEAIDKGAIALFGEKYGDVVRVLAMGGDYSVELCGGTHVRRTGDIGYMCIASESSVAAGTRRIEALTGERAVAHARGAEQLIGRIGQVVGGGRENLLEKVESLSQQAKSLQKELETLKARFAQSRGFDLASEAVDVGGIQVLGAEVEGDSKAVLTTLDKLKDKLGTAVIVLGQVNGGRVNLTVGVTKNLTERSPPATSSASSACRLAPRAAAAGRIWPGAAAATSRKRCRQRSPRSGNGWKSASLDADAPQHRLRKWNIDQQPSAGAREEANPRGQRRDTYTSTAEHPSSVSNAFTRSPTGSCAVWMPARKSSSSFPRWAGRRIGWRDSRGRWPKRSPPENATCCCRRESR